MNNGQQQESTPSQPATANIDKLASLLGFDPTKASPGVSDAMSAAMAEIAEENKKKAQGAAKALLTEAIQLSEQMAKADREYRNQKAKFDKNLGKLLRRIEGMASGKPVQEDEEKQE